MAARRRREGTKSERVLLILIAVALVAVGLAGGLLLSRTGSDRPAATDALQAVTPTTSTTEPPTTTTTVPPTTTTTSVCNQSEPIGGCPLGTPAAIAWSQQQQDQAAQATAAQQAAAAQQAEQAYEQCLGNDAEADAAAIQQEFSGQVPAGTPTWEPCSTAGLTPAQIQQAQGD